MRVLASAAALAAALALCGCGYGDKVVQTFWQSEPAAAPAPAAPPAAPAQAATPAAAAATAPAAPSTPAAAAKTREPFVVIRFEGAPPDYAAPLYDAMRGALARKPDIAFDLVAVTNDGDAAAKHLDAVLRTMTAMGLPASRISLSAAAAADDATDEVWVYVR